MFTKLGTFTTQSTVTVTKCTTISVIHEQGYYFAHKVRIILFLERADEKYWKKLFAGSEKTRYIVCKRDNVKNNITKTEIKKN